MNRYEKLSLTNNVRVLKNHPIYLLLPKGIDTTEFLLLAPHVKVKFFSQTFFNTYKGSNLFWLTPEIYDTFKKYQYLLKCELDAFVFRDELSNWCNEGYDYVGAPWINHPTRMFAVNQLFDTKKGVVLKIKSLLSGNMNHRSSFVGNGGLSLRKTSTFRYLTRALPYIFPNVFRDNYQEDVVWSIYVSSYFSLVFKRPPYQKAAFFSMETNLEECMKLTSGELPFGCHAWYKYNMSFWEPYISSFTNV